MGHILDYLQSVVRLFRKGVSKQVKLLQVLEVGQELEEIVQVSQLIVPDQKDVQKLVLGKASNVRQFIVLTEDLLAAEVARDVVEIL